jgi:hypothetical protein
MLLFYMVEGQQDPAHSFHPYLSMLPIHADDPLHWPPDLLHAELDGTQLLPLVVRQRSELKADFVRLEAVLKSYSVSSPAVFSFETLLWAKSMYTSRAFPAKLASFVRQKGVAIKHLPKTGKWARANTKTEEKQQSQWNFVDCAGAPESWEGAEGVMLPVIDFFNHRPSAEVMWVGDGDAIELLVDDNAIGHGGGNKEEPRISTNKQECQTEDAGCSTVVVPSGTEVFNNYGAQSNGDMLLKYGFCMENNQADTVTVSIELREAEGTGGLFERQIGILRESEVQVQVLTEASESACQDAQFAQENDAQFALENDAQFAPSGAPLADDSAGAAVAAHASDSDSESDLESDLDDSGGEGTGVGVAAAGGGGEGGGTGGGAGGGAEGAGESASAATTATAATAAAATAAAVGEGAKGLRLAKVGPFLLIQTGAPCYGCGGSDTTRYSYPTQDAGVPTELLIAVAVSSMSSACATTYGHRQHKHHHHQQHHQQAALTPRVLAKAASLCAQMLVEIPFSAACDKQKLAHESTQGATQGAPSQPRRQTYANEQDQERLRWWWKRTAAMYRTGQRKVLSDAITLLNGLAAGAADSAMDGAGAAAITDSGGALLDLL